MASSEPLGSNSPQCSVSRGLFHSRCAENVHFENEKQVAYLKGGFGDYVFSANPIPVGEMFQVKILEKRTGWLPLGIGFTTVDPMSFDLGPENVDVYKRSKKFWMLHGSAVFHGDTVHDLRFSMKDLQGGDSVGVHVNDSGAGTLFVKYVENKGIVFENIPQDKPVWGMIYLSPGTKVESEFDF